MSSGIVEQVLEAVDALIHLHVVELPLDGVVCQQMRGS